VRHILRPYLAAGYTPGAVLHCIDHEPSGRCHGYTAAVRHPAGWLRSRMSLWVSPAGVPVPPPSQRRAAEREQLLARSSRHGGASGRKPLSAPRRST
jgi:hypothetical protein